MSSLEEGQLLNKLNQNLISNINMQDITKSKNIDLYLMDKDKEIINLSNQTTSLKNNIESLQKIIKEKDMEINSLKSDILTLTNDQKLKEEENVILKAKINSLIQELTNSKKEIETISVNNNDNLKNISQAFDTKMIEYQKLMQNFNEMSRDLNILNEKLIQSEKDNLYQQKLIQDLRNENKKIVLLNRNLIEKENIIKSLEKIVRDNKDEIYHYQKEKKFLNDQLQNQANKEEFIYKTRLNLQEYENAINDMKNNFNNKIKNQELIIKEYQNNIKASQINNENLINYIINQIQKVGDNFEKHITNPLFNDEILINFSQPSENDSKYELIHQNFILLTHKLIEFKNKTNAEIIKLKNELDEEQKNKNNLLNNIQLQKMSKNSIENSIGELKKIVEVKNGEIRDLNMKINKLITENTKNNNYNNNINKEEDKIFNEFFHQFFDMVTNFYIESINKKNNLFQIQAFPNFSILDSKQKKLNDILITIRIFIDYTNSISNQLASIYNNSRVNYSDQKNKNNNINQNKFNIDMNKNISSKDLQRKIKEMSDLLKQSNYYLDISRQENKKIKDKYNALMNNFNNFNSLKNNDNSQVGLNSASFEEIKKNNIDMSISNPTLSKNYINNSNLNHSNQNNPEMFGNNSNSFNLNNTDKMNVFNNNNNNNNINYANQNQNIPYNMNNNNNNMIENPNQLNQMYDNDNNEEEIEGDEEEAEENIANYNYNNNYNQDFQNDIKNAENERALNAFINQYTNDVNENNQQNYEENNFNQADNDQEQEQEEIYYDDNEGEEEFNGEEEYNEMNNENEDEGNYEEEINNDYNDNNNEQNI